MTDQPTLAREIKTGIKLKELDDTGTGLARIATLSAIDSDGDTYAAGAFGDRQVQIMPAHDWRAVPLGRARIFEQGDEALAEFRLNLDTAAAREWHAALKFDLAQERPLQEWSYGYDILEAETEIRDGERVRVLKRLEVFEVSPVLRGAGVATTTLAVKSGLPFRDQIAAAYAEARAVIERAEQIAALRGLEGRSLSPERLSELAGLKSALEEAAKVAADLDTVLRAADLSRPEALAKAGRAFARFETTRFRLAGRAIEP
jgi:hypothetical protein